MKTNILKVSVLVCSVLMLVTAVLTPSCQKDKTCYGNVTVYDTNGNYLSNASVQLFHPGDTSKTYISMPGNIVYSGITDSKGFVKFVIKLPAVYTIKVLYPSNNDRYKLGVLILNDPGSTDNQTIHF